jgi:quercetin 2,3-dioxygenase
MIRLRRDRDRHHVQRGKRDTRLTFYPRDPAGPVSNGFGALARFNEIRLGPGGILGSRPRVEAEVVTHVREGALAQEDSAGSSGVLHAGEFQRLTTGRGIRQKETNASRTHATHVFQIVLRPSEAGLDRAHEQRHFTTAQRRNALCVVASQDGRKGSLRVHQDALIYSALLDPGHHLVHELSPGRCAWLHLVHGEATLADIVLNAGDGVGVTEERALSMTAVEETEILVIDLGAERPWPLRDGGLE